MSSKPSSFISDNTEKATGENAALAKKLQAALADFEGVLTHTVHARNGNDVISATTPNSGKPQGP
ncbi:MAG: hypothetical protein ACD_42C00593G0002 [uncultured bacterium]|nr:MAG: hypothetical protein ACD_42C00593G0002 [uncultured bacterium]OGT32728.1 MAG: hypothetical protein A3C44_00440 [Gammaproteobacteria bacterium RIFCSPHIGHO2_02_FULL_39_13]OGT48692.1 MAG: hypothetical protein A3E53_05410 [Gammaproteobacteria bacterium RIFCSPHIGHO2_12_FULL_39_24]